MSHYLVAKNLNDIRDINNFPLVPRFYLGKDLANPGKIFPTPRTCKEAARAQLPKEFESVERF